MRSIDAVTWTEKEIDTFSLGLRFVICVFKCLRDGLTIAAYYLPQNAGDIARKYIQDPQLLSFIDAEVGCSILLKFVFTILYHL